MLVQLLPSQVTRPLFFSRGIALVLLIALTALVVVRGIAPPLSSIDSDFPNYLTAAKIVANGGDTNRLYDDAWFQEQMRQYGMNFPGKFSPFPPPTALLMVPFAGLGAQTALRIMTLINIASLLGAIVLLSRILCWRVIDAAVFVLLSGYAVLNSFRLGQPYLLASALCIAGYYAYRVGRPVLAGVCFGVFLPIKYFPAVIVLYFALVRNWKIVFGAVSTVIGITLISLLVLGVKVHETFLLQVLGNHLVANLSLQDPFGVTYQSFDSLFRRLFVFDAVANPNPIVRSELLRITALLVVKAAIFAATAAALLRFKRRRGELPAAICVGLFGIATLLAAPTTSTYHFAFLWLPVALLVQFFIQERALIHAYVVLGAYVAIGFFPYKFAFRFDGHGLLTVLAYPRLLLLLVMFGTCFAFLIDPKEPTKLLVTESRSRIGAAHEK